MMKQGHKRISRYMLLMLIFVVATAFSSFAALPQKADAASKKTVYCKVIRVVDGDTVILNYKGRYTRTRLIGVDTPESVSPQEYRNCKEGRIASKYTKKRLSSKTVRVVAGKDPRDKYGRLLAYIYIHKEFYNYTLVRIGYARVMSIWPNTKYAYKFRRGQAYAKRHDLGFWKTGYYH